MEHMHLAGEDEDDMYAGFNDYNATLDTFDIENDAGFQQAVRTSYGNRPPPTAAARGGGASRGRGGGMPPSSMGARPITGAQQGDGAARPMTAVRAAGFTSFGNRGAGFDPMNQSNKGPAPALESKVEDTPEEKIKLLEKKINELIEESCFAASRNEHQLALEKAKESGRKERILVRQREQIAGSGEQQLNLDLTYSVLFNLANQYAANEMYGEAINTYQVIVKNQMFTNAGRLRVNMGNVYFKQKKYDKAVKNYQMALDRVPNTHQKMKIKIMQNIGIVYVKMGQYDDAKTSFEHIMAEEPDYKTGFNLILCYFALGDRDKMKHAFKRLLAVDNKFDDEDKYSANSEDKEWSLIVEVIKNDTLYKIERDKKMTAERCIKTSAKIISPAIENTYSEGYDWCIEQVKTSNYMELAHDLEIDKAIGYLKQKDFQQAIETLKSFEKKDTKVASTAATNLAFLYYLENEQSQAEKYGTMALKADRYNPSALVNMGNLFYSRKDYEKARQHYQDALSNDSSCVEALYNQGLANKRLERYEDALESFYKLHAILRNNAQVMYQIGDIHDRLGDPTQSTEWFLQLLGVVPTDAHILQRLGVMYQSEGDKSQAYQYHYDSYRNNPSNLDVINWLGVYYIDSQFCEKAISYFERAALMQPNEIKWHIMVATCHRKAGNYQQSYETYKAIHKKFPDNADCLKYLVHLSNSMGLKESQEYANKLKRVEKMQKIRDERVNSGSRRGSGRRRHDGGGMDRQNSAGSASRGSSATSRDLMPSTYSDMRPFAKKAGSRQTSGHGGHRTIDLSQDSGPYQVSGQGGNVDSTYADPLGPQIERPKTAANRRGQVEEEFADEELGDDLLPE